MIPEAQTLFSLTLFLALSSLLAWKNRRDQNRRLAPPTPDQPGRTA